MSEIKVNKISPKQTCTQLTLGDSGDTIIIPAGATIQNSGTATGFGATGAVNWDTTPKTTTVTAVSGTGYFVNTTSGAITVNLPAGSAGAIVAVSDYANISATNNIIITPNGTDKIDGVNASYYLATNGAAITLIYVDSTRGWKDVNDATLNAVGAVPTFVVATGGTILTCGNYKTHVFTGPGTFTVCSVGNSAGSNSVEYMVVAGGAGGGSSRSTIAGKNSGGGGAGGFRQNYPSPTTAGLPITAQAYPITVGGGGTGSSSSSAGGSGNNSVFSTITSAGGGGGGSNCTGGTGTEGSGAAGGSGGGGASAGAGTAGTGGAGNTPPVSPVQGFVGGSGLISCPGRSAGGGGGAAAAGTAGTAPTGGPGGIGSPVATAFFGPTAPSYGTPGPAPGRYFAGGGGGSGDTARGSGGSGGGGGAVTIPQSPIPGTTNTGGGGGGTNGGGCLKNGGNGGSGIVAIRYKFQ
jgi:hypothetical protein